VLPSTQGRPLSALMLASETRRPAARHRERGGAIAGRAKAEERAGLEPTLPPQPSARALPWEAVLIAPRLPSRIFFSNTKSGRRFRLASGARKPKTRPVNPDAARQTLPSGSHRPPVWRRIRRIDPDASGATRRPRHDSNQLRVGHLSPRHRMRRGLCRSGIACRVNRRAEPLHHALSNKN